MQGTAACSCRCYCRCCRAAKFLAAPPNHGRLHPIVVSAFLSVRCREQEEQRSIQANGSGPAPPRLLASLDHEAPMGSVELQQAAAFSRYQGGDRSRLMAGHVNSSSAYDPAED